MQTLTTSKTSSTVSHEPYLTLENISKSYPTPQGPSTVLEGIDLAINEGSLFA